jgi:biotin/methionine sulfoxide reductase
MIANQPLGRLHSQLDMGAASMSTKPRRRETLTMHPEDAAARGLEAGDAVRVTSAREASFFAVLCTSDAVSPGVVQIPAGAWFDPDFAERTCVHGNPNAVTRDCGSLRVGQGCTGQLTSVQMTVFTGEQPPLGCHEPPRGVLATQALSRA